MRLCRFPVEQIVAVLRQDELSMAVADACRKMGISEQTFYRWKKQYGSLEPDQARELKQLQEENARLKKLVAGLSLDKAIFQDIAAKNGPARAEGAGPGLCPGPLRHQSASGLPTGSGVAKHALLRTSQGSAAGVATTHTGVAQAFEASLTRKESRDSLKTATASTSSFA